MTTIQKTVLLLVASLGAIFSSCTNEPLNNVGPQKGNQRQVTMSVQMPGKFTQGATRAMSEAAENNLSKATFMVFTAGGNYAYHKTSTTINGAGNLKTIAVTLTTDGGAYDIAVLANLPLSYTDEVLAAALTDKTIDDIHTVLASQELAGKWTGTEFIMSGELRNQTLSSATTVISGLTLLRSLASVDVGLAWNGTTWDGLSNFNITEVLVYNANNKFSTYPNPAFLAGGISVNKPTIPALTASIGNSEATALRYTDVAGASGTSAGNGQRIASEVYIGEVNNLTLNDPATRPALVLGGSFNGGATSYYRLDFAKTNLDGTLNTYLDILRNYKYRFNIKEVQGAGYTTADEAFASKAINITVNVQPWDQGDINDVIQNGQYRLGVSQGIYNLSKEAVQSTVTIKTDWTSAPTITYSTSATDPNAGAPAWITQSAYTPNGSGSGLNFHELKFDVLENTGAPRTAYIFIKAGILPPYIVTVNQTDVVPMSLQILRETAPGVFTEEVSMMSFVQDAAATAPTAQKYKVKWSPADATVAISLSDLAGYAAIDWDVTGTNQRPGAEAALNDAFGERTFTIQPNAFSGYTTGSFDELQNLLTARMIVSGEMVLKTVVFQQTVKDMKPTVESLYFADGSPYSFNVKSNRPWKAFLVDNGGGMVAAPAVVSATVSFATGDYNLTEGTNVGFTTVDDITNPTIFSGTGKVRIEWLSGDDPTNLAHWTTTYIDLNCASGKIQPESNSYIVALNGEGILIPVSRANESMLGPQLGANEAFTAELVWTDNANKIAANSNIKMIRAAGSGAGGHILVLPGSVRGNAVVAVKNSANKILWSWHIWVTGYNPTPVGTGQFMDRNLGAFSNTSTADVNDISAKGLMYQWGRKDPFPSSTTLNGNAEPTLYTATGTTAVTRVEVPAANNFANSVANPATFYYKTADPYDWYTNGSAQNVALWGPASKTVYDPCPDGWRVPQNGVWAGLTVANFPWGNYGRTADSHGGFYPATGYRSNSGGELGGVGEQGIYWSATVTGGRSYNLYLSSSNMAPSSNNGRANGMSVRCVKE